MSKLIPKLLAFALLCSMAISQTSQFSLATEAPTDEAESHALSNALQLTFADRFFKAGESYFSPDDSKIIFQAVEQPEAGQTPKDFYGMYVGDIVRDQQGRITGLANIKRLSPDDSANTCGWFHPTQPDIVIFGSTISAPSENTAPGYQRGSGRYRWMFPPEMDIVSCDLNKADGTAASLRTIIGDRQGYLAECSYSHDGRHLLYCSLEENQGDLFTYDTKTHTKTHLVDSPGYDGGPFFSPDGTRVCYRSDRRGNNLLQIYIGELKFNNEGTVVGIEREFQITDNAHVNWAPFWHPAGKHLIYTTSEIGHRNYEVFIVDADPGRDGPVKYGTRKRRITVADGFDGLPVFDSKGTTMLWTSQRSEDGRSQLWVADFVLDIDATPMEMEPQTHAQKQEPREITATDPESGLIYLYNPTTHKLTAYNPRTHKQRDVSDPDEISKAKKLLENADR
ncbi:MAG: hypothetical protein O7G85_01240 [Planctomycetota bacterium]|nr:hypothetical protein [Planctomycetota bacterium]